MDVEEKAAEGWNHVEPLGPASIYSRSKEINGTLYCISLIMVAR